VKGKARLPCCEARQEPGKRGEPDGEGGFWVKGGPGDDGDSQGKKLKVSTWLDSSAVRGQLKWARMGLLGRRGLSRQGGGGGNEHLQAAGHKGGRNGGEKWGFKGGVLKQSQESEGSGRWEDGLEFRLSSSTGRVWKMVKATDCKKERYSSNLRVPREKVHLPQEG